MLLKGLRPQTRLQFESSINPAKHKQTNKKATLTPPCSGLKSSRIIADEQKSPPSEPDDLLSWKHNSANPLQAHRASPLPLQSKLLRYLTEVASYCFHMKNQDSHDAPAAFYGRSASWGLFLHCFLPQLLCLRPWIPELVQRSASKQVQD